MALFVIRYLHKSAMYWQYNDFVYSTVVRPTVPGEKNQFLSEGKQRYVLMDGAGKQQVRQVNFFKFQTIEEMFCTVVW